MNANAIVDIASLNRGLTGAMNNTGVLLPLAAIDMIHRNINLGGNEYVSILVETVFRAWKYNTISASIQARLI